MATTTMPFVSLEDHFVSGVCQADDVAETLALHQFPDAILKRLVDVGDLRLKAMDEGEVGLQVVSHIPVVISLKECRATNDELCESVKRKGRGRFAGFATLPMAEPASIAAELERCVEELGFVGALIPNHAEGKYYDGDEYLDMWRMAEQLGVAIYLHPCPPTPQMTASFRGNYSEDVVFGLSTHAWDWHANCALHFIRLYAAGLFDQCPNLKIVLGHLGEMLPFMLGRIERKLALTKDAKTWKTSFRQVYARNVWVTTSGMFDIESFRCTLNTTHIDRIMYSVDYPFESVVLSKDFMETVRNSGLVSAEEYAKIAHKNAEALLNVRVAT